MLRLIFARILPFDYHCERVPDMADVDQVPEDGLEDEEEIILSELPDDELVEQMHADLYDGLKEEIVEGTNILLARGWSPDKVLNIALVEGMRIVGIDFRDGILFVPEVLLAANAMKAGMAVLRPLLAEVGAEGHDATRARVHDISRGGVRLGIDEVEDWAGTNHCIIRFLDKTHRVRPAAIRGKVRRTGKDCDDSFVAIEFAEPLDELTLSV